MHSTLAFVNWTNTEVSDYVPSEGVFIIEAERGCHVTGRWGIQYVNMADFVVLFREINASYHDHNTNSSVSDKSNGEKR